MNRALLSVAFTISLLLAGCAGSQGPIQLTVFGAASLSKALDQVKAAYESSHADTTLSISTGASSALRTQIEQGAPADVFLSADTTNPQTLVDAGSTDGTAVPFATNVLTIVVPRGNPAGIVSAADLGRSGVHVIAAGEEVPITKYAKQCVDELGALSGYPPGFAASYEANIASREDNVGAVVSKIQLGEGDAAIVYVTDARSAEVDTVDIPPDANVTAAYAGVVLKTSAHAAAAHALLDWIRGAEGETVFTSLGFSPAP